MSRVNGALEKAFRKCNEYWYGNQLEEPIITVTPTANAYAHYTLWNAWHTSKGERREINISSNYLNRDIENIIASLLHEMAHMYNDTILNVKDTSRNGTYHNLKFKETAEKHGLIIEQVPVYGWTKTTPSPQLIEWIYDNLDAFREIVIYRDTDISASRYKGGNNATGPSRTRGTNNHSIKYICPCCLNSVRATKRVRVACMDCGMEMVES